MNEMDELTRLRAEVPDRGTARAEDIFRAALADELSSERRPLSPPRNLFRQLRPTWRPAIPLRAPAPHRGRRVSRWLAPVAAMMAVAAIAGVTVAGRQTGHALAPAAGRPDIYVTVTARYLQPLQTSTGHRPVPASSGHRTPVVSFYDLSVGTATIRDASTGAVLTSVQLWPRQQENPRGPAVNMIVPIAAAADNRTFAISDQGGFYLLHVADSGRAARLDRLNIRFPGGYTPIDFDLSPDGTKLAEAVICPSNGAGIAGISIITLATGAARTWCYSSPADQAEDPSWTDNGKAVMFFWSPRNGALFGYRLLSAAAPHGNLTAESVLLPYPPAEPAAYRTYPTGWVQRPAILTPDGRNLLIVTQKIVPASRNSGTTIYRITDVAPRTGRVLRVLRVFQTHYQGNPYLSDTACNILSLAPSGLHALVQCPQLGRLDGSTFTPLPGGPPLIPLSTPMAAAAW